MSKPMIRIHDLATDEIIDREMNNAEFAVWQEEQAVYEARKADAEAKAAKRAELLTRLGITEEEARILLG